MIPPDTLPELEASIAQVVEDFGSATTEEELTEIIEDYISDFLPDVPPVIVSTVIGAVAVYDDDYLEDVIAYIDTALEQLPILYPNGLNADAVAFLIRKLVVLLFDFKEPADIVLSLAYIVAKLVTQIPYNGDYESFLGDIFVDKLSQQANGYDYFDTQPFHYTYNGLAKSGGALTYSSTTFNLSKKSINSLGIPHNLECRDPRIIDYIIDDL